MMHAILPSDSRMPARQRHRVSTVLMGRGAAVAAVMILAVWVLTGEKISAYMQPQDSLHKVQDSLHKVHSLHSASTPSSSGSHGLSRSISALSRLSAGGLLDTSSSLQDLAGDDWDYNTLDDTAVLSMGSMDDIAQAQEGDSSSSSSSSSNSSDSSAHSFSSSYTNQLMQRLTAEQQQAKDPVYLSKLRAAAATPINVVFMSGLFWEYKESSVRGCSVDGVPLDCRFTADTGNISVLDAADALYYHVPSFAGRPRPKAFPSQLRLAMSLESSAYYEDLDNPGYMCHFDAEMTYRHCSQVINWYSLDKFARLFKDPTIPQLPFEEKMHAIAYINSNCGAQSGRSDIMRALMALGNKAKVPVHSYGSCDRNMEWPDGNPSKFNVFGRYKFCVTMENSLRQDYITEKLWDGLVAGCVPVYLGSSAARDVVPDPNSFIAYDAQGNGNASTPEELDALMHAIGSDKQRYEAMLAWKHRQPHDQSSKLFRHLWDIQHTSGECMLCQFLARHRAEPQPHYTTCLFNQDWMTAARQYYVPQEEACPAVQQHGKAAEAPSQEE